jgi:hypothetical protein
MRLRPRRFVVALLDRYLLIVREQYMRPQGARAIPFLLKPDPCNVDFLQHTG